MSAKQKTYNTFNFIESQTEFNELSKKNFQSLFSLLVKFIRNPSIVKTLIYDIKNKKIKDKKVYEIITSKVSGIKITEEQKIKRAKNKAENFVYILPQNTYNSYLDVGASDCSITEQLGILLKVPEKNVYGIDIKSWSGKDNEKITSQTRCNFQTYDGVNIPDFGIKFELVSLFQVMHHVPVNQRKKLIQNISNVMTKNGILLLREHNCKSKEDSMLIDVEHGIWDNSVNKVDGFFETYYGEYGSTEYWTSLFSSCGFLLVETYFEDKTYELKPKNHFQKSITVNGNPTNYYHAVYQKK